MHISAQCVKSPENESFGSVFPGYGHSYFITKQNREIYGAGNGSAGQFAGSEKLQDLNYEIIVSPLKLVHPKIIGKSVKLLASGYAYCLIGFDDGSGIVFGNNASCQCGYTTPNIIIDPLPLNIPSKSPIKGLSAGTDLSLCMTVSHEIFVTGEVNNGNKYSTWTNLTYSDIPYSNIYDAYIIQKTIYLLTLERVIFIGGRQTSCDLSSVTIESENNDPPQTLVSLHQHHVFLRDDYNDNSYIFFYTEHTLKDHFIFKFSEATPLSDCVIIF